MTVPVIHVAHTATLLDQPANHCTIGNHRPGPLRYVWHHLLPLVCGGHTEPGNLLQVCDNCHYSIHRLMTLLLHNSGFGTAGTAGQRHYAQVGWDQAVALGTQGKMPYE